MSGVIYENVISAAKTYGVMSNIAALRAATTATVQCDQLQVLGYYADGDGGEGGFWYDAADTTSADNGGTIIVDSSGRRWYRLGAENGPYSVLWFGAVPGGTTDTTAQLSACFTTAAAAGTAVFVPSGTFLYSTLTLTGNVLLYGLGQQASILMTSTTNVTAISIPTGTQHEISGIQFSARTQQASPGVMIAFAGDGSITDCLFSKYNIALQMTGNTGLVGNVRFSSPTPSTGVGITLNGYAGGIFLDQLLFYAVSPTAFPLAGIQVFNAGAVQIADSEVISQGIDLFICPGNGQSVDSLWAFNTFFDTATIGVAIAPSGTGSVVRCKFVGCWTCSHTNNGFSIENAGTGTVGSIIISEHEAMFNQLTGLEIGGNGGTISDVIVANGRFSANTSNGILVGASVTDFTLIGNNCGNGAGANGNGGYGIALPTGSQNRFNITDNRLEFNTDGPLLDQSTGTTKSITGNIGFNPVGASTITLTGSTYTWTNNLGYAVIMLWSNASGVTGVFLNAAGFTGSSGGTVVVPHGQTFGINWTSAPTLERIGLN